jgi:hypothetical protein
MAESWFLVWTENYNYACVSESLNSSHLSVFVNTKFESEVVSFSVHYLMTWYVYNSSHNCVRNNIVVVLLVLVKICHIMNVFLNHLIHHIFLSLITEYWIQNIHTIVFFGFIHEKSQVHYEESNIVLYHMHIFV